MILKTLREFELEEENRQLKRQLAEMRRQPLAPIVVEETPTPEPASWEDTERELVRVARCSRVWQQHDPGYKTLLECRNPRPTQGPGESVRKYSSGYFIARDAAISDEALAHIGAQMHMQMLASLHSKFLHRHEEFHNTMEKQP